MSVVVLVGVSVTVIKHQDQSNLKKKSFFHVIVPEMSFMTELSWWEAGQQAWWLEQQAERSQLEHQAGSRAGMVSSEQLGI